MHNNVVVTIIHGVTAAAKLAAQAMPTTMHATHGAHRRAEEENAKFVVDCMIVTATANFHFL